MDGGDESRTSLYGVLLDRFQSLESSQQKLREQFEVLLQNKTSNISSNTFREKEVISDSEDVTSFPGWGCHPQAYLLGNPYRSVLEHMGHAVYVCKAGSWEIIYWNPAAEKLYGYKDYEIIGQRVVEVLYDEVYHPSSLALMERLSTGESWSGQLPMKKRTGENFMAMVTMSAWYEDEELVGIITVSSDAAVFNYTNSGNMTTHENHSIEHSKFRRINLKKIQWHPQQQIAAVPQLASSVSNLASKVLLRKRGDVTENTCRTTREREEAEVESHDVKADRPPRAPTTKPAFNLSIGRRRTEAMSSEREESTSEVAQPSKIAVKFFSKLPIGAAVSNLERVMDENIQQNGTKENSMKKNAAYETHNRRNSTDYTYHLCNLYTNNHVDGAQAGISEAVEGKYLDMHMDLPAANQSFYNEAASGAYQVSTEVSKPADQLSRSSFLSDGRESVANMPNIKSADSEDTSPREQEHKIPSSAESSGGGPGSSSSKSDNDSRVVVNTKIRWEDLQLREEIGQGSFAVVYHGIWNGSDVAVKVYTGNQYNEKTLLDYKKEIDIMRRLRHPNVLLFMGAACTEEKLAMVTEYMPRGSLFKTLHRNNQSSDIRRRLRMAIDVARGMNYLHHRNPPIVHRDLKSSNLLVDKSWNVKVGNFGLSKLKNATFLTARSGRGTPQWMAPEVLRNEPSTEKSDVFSFGVILWELMTECIPWKDLKPLQVVGIVGFMDRRLDLPENIDPQVSSIISACWQRNPEDRPSFEDILHKMTDLVHTGAAGTTTRTASTP